MRVRRGIFLALVLASAALPASATTQATGPTTLVRAPHEIVVFAQERGRLAWVEIDDGCTSGVRLRAARGGPTTVHSLGCGSVDLVLAGGRLLVLEATHGNSTYTNAVLVTSLGRAIELENPHSETPGLVLDQDGGAYVGAIGGRGALLVYSVVIVHVDCEDDLGQLCSTTRTGEIWRVDGVRKRLVSKSDGGPSLAVAGSNVASVPASGPAVVVRNVPTGKVVASFLPTGEPIEVALSTAVVAVLVEWGSRRRIEIRDPQTGRLVRNVPVPRRASSIAAAGRHVVYAVRSAVYSLDTRTFVVRRLAMGRGEPIGLSIDGRRVAWAENVAGRGFIKSVILAD